MSRKASPLQKWRKDYNAISSGIRIVKHHARITQAVVVSQLKDLIPENDHNADPAIIKAIRRRQNKPLALNLRTLSVMRAQAREMMETRSEAVLRSRLLADKRYEARQAALTK